ncbi:unnamed protein product [Musa acuminata subsp. burmannicoides]
MVCPGFTRGFVRSRIVNFPRLVYDVLGSYDHPVMYANILIIYRFFLLGIIPFLSGLLVPLGDARHLRLDLSTAFTANPSFRLSDHPNNAAALLSLVIKTGLGPIGSPDMGGPVSLVAEFSLLARSGVVDPSFSILFKPHYGDFAIKKIVSSITALAVAMAEFDPLGGMEGDDLIDEAETLIVRFCRHNGVPET